MYRDEDTIASHIQDFLAADAYAVVGASANRRKYGNKVLRCYLQHNKALLLNPLLWSVQ